MLRVKRIRIPMSKLPRIYHGPMPVIKLDTAPLSNQQLLNLPIQKQVVEQLKQAQVITFSNLVKSLAFTYHEEILLDILKEVGVMVQGNWLLRSSLLYPPSFKSSNGVDRVHIMHAYYQILNKFQHTSEVTHGEMQVLTQLPASDVTEILKMFAKPVKQTKTKVGHWVFKLPKDENFIKTYEKREEIFKLLEERLNNWEKQSYRALGCGVQRMDTKKEVDKTISVKVIRNKNLKRKTLEPIADNTLVKKPLKSINMMNKKLLNESKLLIKEENTRKKPGAKQEEIKNTKCARKQTQSVCISQKKIQHDRFMVTRSMKLASNTNKKQALRTANKTDDKILQTVKKINPPISAKGNKSTMLKPEKSNSKESKMEPCLGSSNKYPAGTRKTINKPHTGQSKMSQSIQNKEVKKIKDSQLEYQLIMQTQKLFECDAVVKTTKQKQSSNLKIKDNAAMSIKDIKTTQISNSNKKNIKITNKKSTIKIENNNVRKSNKQPNDKRTNLIIVNKEKETKRINLKTKLQVDCKVKDIKTLSQMKKLTYLKSKGKEDITKMDQTKQKQSCNLKMPGNNNEKYKTKPKKETVLKNEKIETQRGKFNTKKINNNHSKNYKNKSSIIVNINEKKKKETKVQEDHKNVVKPIKNLTSLIRAKEKVASCNKKDQIKQKQSDNLKIANKQFIEKKSNQEVEKEKKTLKCNTKCDKSATKNESCKTKKQPSNCTNNINESKEKRQTKRKLQIDNCKINPKMLKSSI